MRRNNMLSLAICAACTAAPASYADTAPGGTDVLGEVVVTAQRREQRMQDVPIAVEVVSTELMAKHVAAAAEAPPDAAAAAAPLAPEALRHRFHRKIPGKKDKPYQSLQGIAACDTWTRFRYMTTYGRGFRV